MWPDGPRGDVRKVTRSAEIDDVEVDRQPARGDLRESRAFPASAALVLAQLGQGGLLDVAPVLGDRARPVHGVDLMVVEQRPDLLEPHGGIAAVTYELQPA